MEELQITLTPARVDQNNFGVMLSNWRVGQVLNALVVDTRPDSGVLLSVGGKQFVATTDIPVQPGTRMSLEVQQLGDAIVLKRINEQMMQAASASGRAAETALALSSARPSALLNQLAAQPGRFGSPDLQELARELLGRSLRGESMTPADLQRALRSSGLFTETDLAAGRSQLAQQSTKARVANLQALALALAEDLDEASAETRVLRQLSDKASGLLSGIASNQLASLPSEDGAFKWVFALPVQLNDQHHDVHMQLERHPRVNENDDEVWSASLHVNLPQLGVVDIDVRMVNEVVSVNFVCAQDQSSRYLEGAMANLKQRLSQRDIDVDQLSSAPQAPAVTETTVGSGHGLDAEA